MADAKPTMVTVRALKYHTTAGEEYHEGDTYSVAESAVDSLAALGMAARTDAEVAKASRAAAKPVKAAKAKKSRAKRSR